jgi:broad specificity phosphatase PhoE
MGDIYLVRHGQVVFGGDGYDSLSPDGERQSAAVGAALAARGVATEHMFVGSMNRHRQTAELAGGAAGWRAAPEVDAGWDEFDHVSVLTAAGALAKGDRSLSGPDTLRRFFGHAIPRWSSGRHDDDYAETFRGFSSRVMDTLQRLARELASDESAVVFTSAGVIGWAAASLLGASEQQWLKLIPVGVNGGVTRIRVTGGSPELVSYNEHAHLGHVLVTYR